MMVTASQPQKQIGANWAAPGYAKKYGLMTFCRKCDANNDDDGKQVRCNIVLKYTHRRWKLTNRGRPLSGTYGPQMYLAGPCLSTVHPSNISCKSRFVVVWKPFKTFLNYLTKYTPISLISAICEFTYGFKIFLY